MPSKQTSKSSLAYHQQKRTRSPANHRHAHGVGRLGPATGSVASRQSHRELERAILELRASGFREEEIQAYARMNSAKTAMESTKTALKEHFILERIAEEENIEEAPEDFEMEIATIAAQTREPLRRVRARIEKQGLMDALRNQIIERKVIEAITSAAEFKEVPYQVEVNQAHAVDHVVSGVKDSAIPVAKHGGDAENLKSPTDRS